MYSTNFISVKEHKLLLATVLFSLSLIFSSVFSLAIKSYNLHIADVEQQQRWSAEGEEVSDFIACNFGQTYPEVWSRFFSFAFLPLCFLLVRRRKSIYLLISFILLLLAFSQFWLWFAKTERFAFYRELQIMNWTDKFLYQSNSFDLLLFYLIPILLIWHILILVRIFLRLVINQTDLT
jgi:hypothetical protein